MRKPAFCTCELVVQFTFSQDNLLTCQENLLLHTCMYVHNAKITEGETSPKL